MDEQLVKVIRKIEAGLPEILATVIKVLELGPGELDEECAAHILLPVVFYAARRELGRELSKAEVRMIVQEIFAA